LQFRLRDLKNRNQILSLEGCRWQKCESSMNGSTTEHTTETFITPSLTEELPVIHLPGDEKFSSYKNTLQEYCQKKHLSVPQYKCTKEQNGLIGTVTFSLNHVRCETVSGSAREADARAAYEALRKLGYLQNDTFELSNQLKRKDGGGDYGATDAKQVKSNKDITAKSALNEYAQKNQIAFPTYNTVPANGGFFATVTFNGKQFKAMSTCKKRKDAEQNAAQVALNAATGAPLPEGEPMAIGEADVTQMISEARQASQTASLKNRLQEYCQRLGKTLPKYNTVVLESDKMFQSTVTVQENEYIGLPQKSKKEAETAAAEEALKALELMA